MLMKIKPLYSVGKLLNKSHFFYALSKNFVKKHNSRKVIYDYWIWKKYNVTPEDIFSFNFLILISGLILTLILFSLIKNSVLSIIIFLISYSSYYYFQSLPYNEAKKDKIFFELYFERLILDYSLILEVYNADEEVFFQILEDIEKMMKLKNFDDRGFFHLIFRGIVPEKVFPKNFSPLQKLNDFLENLNLHHKSSQLNLIDYSEEMKTHAGNYSIETKLSFFFFFSIFYPFGVSLLAVVQLLDLSFFLTVLVLFPLFCYKIREMVLLSTIRIFGLEEESSKELKTFILFLDQFGRYLEFYPPEYALLLVFKNLNFQENLIKNQSFSIKNLFSYLLDVFKSNKICNILTILQNLIRRDSRNARDKIILIKNRLQLQINIQKQRVQQIKAHRIKIFCFILILPIIFGVLTSLFPLFSNFSILGFEFETFEFLDGLWYETQFSITFPFYFFGLLFFTIISGLNLSKLLLEKNSNKLVVLSCLVFVFSFWISMLFLNFNLM